MEVFPGRILFKKRRRREHEFLEEWNLDTIYIPTSFILSSLWALNVYLSSAPKWISTSRIRAWLEYRQGLLNSSDSCSLVDTAFVSVKLSSGWHL
jgi:hypothetical protein